MLSGKEKISGSEGAEVDEIMGKITLDKRFNGIFPITDFNIVEVGPGAKIGNDLQAWEKISIGDAALVNGNILSDGKIVIRASSDSPTTIVGDVIVDGDLVFEPPDETANDGTIVIHGNVYAENVDISTARVLIRGDLYVDYHLKSLPKEGVFVAGRIRVGLDLEQEASAELRNTGAFGILNYGDTTLHQGVSLLEPLLVVKNGTIKSSAPEGMIKLRVLSPICAGCDIVDNPLFCNEYYDNTCTIYESLDHNDVFHYNTNGSRTNLISWYWRAGIEQIKHNVFVYFAYKNALKRPENVYLTENRIDNVLQAEIFANYSSTLSNPRFSYKEIMEFLEQRISHNPLVANDHNVKYVMELLAERDLNPEAEVHEINSKLLETIPLAHLDKLEEFNMISEQLEEVTEVRTKTAECFSCESIFLWNEGNELICPKCGSDDISLESGETGIFDQLKTIFQEVEEQGSISFQTLIDRVPDAEVDEISQFLKTRFCIIDTELNRFYTVKHFRQMIYTDVAEIGIYQTENFVETYKVPVNDIRMIFQDFEYMPKFYLSEDNDYLLHYDTKLINKLAEILIEENYLAFTALSKVELPIPVAQELAAFVMSQLEVDNAMIGRKAIISDSYLLKETEKLFVDSENLVMTISQILTELELDTTHEKTDEFLQYLIMQNDADYTFYLLLPEDQPKYVIYYPNFEEKVLSFLTNRSKISYQDLGVELPDEIFTYLFNSMLDMGVLKGSLDPERGEFEKSIEMNIAGLLEEREELKNQIDRKVVGIKVSKLADTEVGQTEFINTETNTVDLEKMYQHVRLKKVEFTTETFTLEQSPFDILWKIINQQFDMFQKIKEDQSEAGKSMRYANSTWAGISDQNSPLIIEVEAITTLDPPVIALEVTVYTNDDELRTMMLSNFAQKLESKYEYFKQEQEVSPPNACLACKYSLDISEFDPDHPYIQCPKCKSINKIPEWMAQRITP